MSKLEDKEIFQELSGKLPLVNQRRDDWESPGKPMDSLYWLDVRNFFISLMAGQEEVAVLPGTFERCKGGYLRFWAEDARNRKSWIEIINVSAAPRE